MKTTAFSLIIIILGILAPIHTASALAIPAYEYGRTRLMYNPDDMYYDHTWHTYQTDWLQAESDAEVATAYALFDFSAINPTVSSAYLSLPVTDARTIEYMDHIPMLLHDIESVEPFRPPDVWPETLAEYLQSVYQARQDMSSGVLFGEFLVPVDSEGTILNIPLNLAAIEVINASMGGTFGIGFSFGRYAWEQNNVEFESAELHLNTAPVPEPGTMLLLISGIGAMSLHLRRRKPR